MTLNDILHNLKKVKGGPGGQFTACCPAHDDRHASLSVSQGEDGRIFLHCYAGCSLDSIAVALGISMKDLYPSTNSQHY